ncbi:MAG: hypothetical protein WAV47_21480 [Blastocatellia bacterium]
MLQQSGGAPTNRLTSVTTSGATANYTYDAAGNVTNDGVHSYQYDAENRVVSVDGGTTAQYEYAHQNRRVTKIVGAAWTHYLWQGSQVIGPSEEASTSLPCAAVLVLTSVDLKTSSFLFRVLRGSIPSTFRLTARVLAGLRLETNITARLPRSCYSVVG